MKKLVTLSMVAFMMIATMCVSSCSTAKSVNTAFEKNGYVITALTPAQQIEVCPVVAKFPALSVNAMGYLTLGSSCTFIYNMDQNGWDSYAAQLQNAGFSNMGIGYVKADKAAGVTYNVSTKTATIFKKDYRLVTFAYAGF